MIDGLAIKGGVAAGGAVTGMAVQYLEHGEREQIRKSFEQALEWSRASEAERTTSAKGGARRVGRGVGSVFARPGKWVLSRRTRDAQRQHGREVKNKKEIRDAIAQGAADLTEAWTEGPPKNITAGSGGVVDWTAVLRGYVEKTALKGTTEQRGGRAEQWRYLVTGSWDRDPTGSQIHEWAGKVVEQVVMNWNHKRKLGNMVAQLNVESGLGLQKALVVSSQSISRSLRWIALSATTTILIGGGGVALLVLFLDKG